jgi:hypothetical protein
MEIQGYYLSHINNVCSLGTEEKRGTTFRSSTDEIFKTPTWNNKTRLKKNQRFREKTGTQDIVKEIKQYQEKWLQHIQRMAQTGYLNKLYNINQKDEDT